MLKSSQTLNFQLFLKTIMHDAGREMNAIAVARKPTPDRPYRDCTRSCANLTLKSVNFLLVLVRHSDQYSYVDLPMLYAYSTISSGPGSSPEKISSRRINVGTRRLLIIDDEPDIGTLLQYIAEDCGFEVVATTTSEAFKASYATFKPTVVVVDLAVPDIDGIELFRWLADEGCTAPILILSGFDDKVLESAKLLGEARGLAMAGIINKPMHADGIRALLDRM